MWAGPPVVALRRVCGHIVGLPLSEEQAVLQPEGVKDSFPQVLSSQDSCVFCKREPQSAANTTRAKGGDNRHSTVPSHAAGPGMHLCEQRVCVPVTCCFVRGFTARGINNTGRIGCVLPPCHRPEGAAVTQGPGLEYRCTQHPPCVHLHVTKMQNL